MEPIKAKRTQAEKILDEWTRAKQDIGRTTHLASSRAWNLAYWQGRRDALLELENERGS